MANIEKLIPHILQWENSITMTKGETLRHAYERARAKGVINVKNDSGGPTLCGVTLTTFRDWRRKQGKPTPTQSDLAKLEYSEWLAILKSVFWDPCKGDRIANQSIANLLVDWRWLNGTQGVKDAQKELGLTADGVVGPKTLAALNAAPAYRVFYYLKAARFCSYYRIVANNSSKKGFLTGWVNRTEAIKFE